MKFCYIDESGTGEEPVLVLAGILADVHRMHVTKAEWSDILSQLSLRIKRPVAEFHTRHFYKGNGIWRDLDGEQRTVVLDTILSWLKDRKHLVVFSAIDKRKGVDAEFQGREYVVRKSGRVDYWRVAAVHMILCIQKTMQSKDRKKGHTVFIFDEGHGGDRLIDFILNPPTWTDSFYGYERFLTRKKARIKNQVPALSMVVDVPYYGNSTQVAMLQIADLFAYLLRRYAELKLGYGTQDYDGELLKLRRWVFEIAALMLPDNTRWKAVGACACSRLFESIAPLPLLTIHKDASS